MIESSTSTPGPLGPAGGPRVLHWRRGLSRVLHWRRGAPRVLHWRRGPQEFYIGDEAPDDFDISEEVIPDWDGEGTYLPSDDPPVTLPVQEAHWSIWHASNAGRDFCLCGETVRGEFEN